MMLNGIRLFRKVIFTAYDISMMVFKRCFLAAHGTLGGNLLNSTTTLFDTYHNCVEQIVSEHVFI